MLGSRIVTLLQREELPVRALVRPSTDAAALEAAGVEIARGDLRDRDSLRAAVQGTSSIVSTANSVARVMGGERGLTIGDVDDQGHASLIEEADAAGVKRFVFLSFADEILDSGTPFARAKRATEQRLRDSPMRETIVRPEMFQEVWLTELVQFDWKAGKLTIFGKGNVVPSIRLRGRRCRRGRAPRQDRRPPTSLRMRGARSNVPHRGSGSIRTRHGFADETQPCAEARAPDRLIRPAPIPAGARLDHGPGAFV